MLRFPSSIRWAAVAATLLLGTGAAVHTHHSIDDVLPDEAGPYAVFQTTAGDIVVQLYPDRAPKTVENFLIYVGSGFYDGLIFHRVVRDVIIQTGRFTPELEARSRLLPLLESEADNGLKNRRGYLAMARFEDPHSAAAEFFINIEHNTDLDYRSKTKSGWGYTVFGQVVKGMDVVDDIARVRTRRRGELRDVPVDAIVIDLAFESAEIP